MGQVIIYMLGLSASRFYIKVDILGYLRGNNIPKKREKIMNVFIHFHLKYKCVSCRKGNVTQSNNIPGYYSYKIMYTTKILWGRYVASLFYSEKTEHTLNYPRTHS